MSLYLGKSLDRCYNIRLPFLDGFYNIWVYFNKRSTFLLFRVDPDFPKTDLVSFGTKINMFKNIESSKFCETFLKLHNYRGENLDILNQFHSVKDEYYSDINFVLNESIVLSKFNVEGKTFYDQLMIYGFTLVAFQSEMIFLLAERQNIVKRLNKKIVRTTGVQIATSSALNMLNEFYEDYRTGGKVGIGPKFPTQEVIKLEDTNGRNT